jgi:hypothetical protein
LQIRKVLAILSAPAIAAALLTMSAAPASSTVQDTTTMTAVRAIPASSKVNPTAADGYVIVHPSDSVTTKDGSTFYPTGPISSDTLVVIAEPDGSLPGGLTEDQYKQVAAQRKSLGSVSDDGLGFNVSSLGIAETPAAQQPETVQDDNMPYAYEGHSTVNWSQAFIGGSHIGLNWSELLYYRFNVNAFTNQSNAGLGLGFYQGYNGSDFGVWSSWYNLGISDSHTTGGAGVPWGNVSANGEFKTKCGLSTICGGHWGPAH